MDKHIGVDAAPTPAKVCTQCGGVGIYPRKNGTSQKLYWRCRPCHAHNMKIVMRRRYATPEGKKAILAAVKKYQMKKLTPKDGKN